MLRRTEVAAAERAGAIERELEAFLGTHYDRLVRLAGLVCHSTATTEDAVQAAMEQAWRRRATLRDASRIKPWLDQIVVREAIRVNRQPWWSRFGRRAAVRMIEPIQGGAADSDRLERSLAQRGDPTEAAWLSLVAGFRRLPLEQRAVVTLHLYAGYSVDETARLMGAGLETTRSRLRLARERLRREVAGDDR